MFLQQLLLPQMFAKTVWQNLMKTHGEPDLYVLFNSGVGQVTALFPHFVSANT